uniref:Uncharacterized protein n=1 Tax=Rhizophagus irregularis (strain DAOM 181602 / DAOM 197198 / MUCL 43194) TaxID=747089 RepID=U9SQM3_RHIID
MFPRGEDMWYPNIPKCNNESTYTYNNKDVSKFSDENELLNTSDKKNIVDMYTVVKQMQLNYIKFNQKKICAELYNGFQNAMNYTTILSSFIGEP